MFLAELNTINPDLADKMFTGTLIMSKSTRRSLEILLDHISLDIEIIGTQAEGIDNPLKVLRKMVKWYMCNCAYKENSIDTTTTDFCNTILTVVNKFKINYLQKINS